MSGLVYSNAAEVKELTERILKILCNLPGVIEAAKVDKRDATLILAADEENEKTQFVKAVNIGIREALAREHVFLFIKDGRFRRPPCPTLYMAEEALDLGNVLGSPGHYLEAGGKMYHIIGEEVLNPGITYEERHFYFQKDFVMFSERRGKNRHVPAFFILPPVPFPELEARKEELGVTNIVSVSPSTTCDDFLRKRYHMSENPEYATILVGFDSR